MTFACGGGKDCMGGVGVLLYALSRRVWGLAPHEILKILVGFLELADYRILTSAEVL